MKSFKLANDIIAGVVKLIDIFIPDMPDSVQLRIDIDEIIANDILNDDESIKKKVSNFHLELLTAQFNET